MVKNDLKRKKSNLFSFKLNQLILWLMILTLYILITPLILHSDNSDNAWIYKIQGDKYFHLKDYAKAIYYYKLALKYNSKYPEVYYMMGRIFKIKKLYDTALYYYKLAEKYKDFFDIKNMEISLFYEITDILFYKRKFDIFRAYCFKIIQKDFYFVYIRKSIYSILNIVPEGKTIFGKAYFRLGYYYFFSGNFITSLKYFYYSRIYHYKIDISYWLISKINFIARNINEYKKNQEIAYSLNKKIKIFDLKYNWKTIPFKISYLQKMELFINEFNGYTYLLVPNE